MESEYIPLLLELGTEQGLSEEQKRMLVTFEVAGQEYPYFGVEYVVTELGLEDATTTERVEAYIEEVIAIEEEYEDQYEEYYQEFGGTIEELLETHG